MNEMRRLINICESALNEITRVTATADGDFEPLSYDDIEQGLAKYLGNMGKAHVWFQEGQDFLVTLEKPTSENPQVEVIAEIQTKKSKPPRHARGSTKPTQRIEGTEIDRRYTGFDLGPKLYRFILKRGFILQSDSLQSRGGASIWNKLASYPDVAVFAQTPKHNYIELEPGDSGELEPVGSEVDTIYTSWDNDPRTGNIRYDASVDEKDAVIYAAAK